ncbi:potassium transporter Kup [Nitrosomonas eutropha]|uniref:Probable potassium transport system protein Kup n=2 Tax=Nitrosomonas eutropha TaxID=916 RepID=KUP_NITEC|nr:potassium transporter Kup [Nitrosomonas eutropha]Q0AIM8.1 RecName: Full=Probable potassium transport system protein Kup [Nitrosomonas eutropha C91]ABI58798.1 potassium transporter [Nitrosomonas eutropha C91]PXV81158.1 KUP system potassium uptake protein [Nitrosomonas eutropha]
MALDSESSASNRQGSRNEQDTNPRLTAALCLTALGVVYGDIATSPLYAFREALHNIAPDSRTPESILGILSLIFWALIILVSIKYLLIIMRADNHGEGGILALLALLRPWRGSPQHQRNVLIVLGLFGAALLYGDGMITPAISVLSAMEGLEVAAPQLTSYIIPATTVILVLLFMVQKRGTARIGRVFGPIMLVWFVVIALLGLNGIIHHPQVLVAVNPYYGINFFTDNGWSAFRVLGGVFLALTGAEALYADMGHVGRAPIRLMWFALVLPALLLNYFGQGALLLLDPHEAQPFFHLAPPSFLYSLVGLATLATIIASQAIISGVFSLTRQAIQLGQSPRLTLVQTSSEEIGQVYVPAANWFMMIAAVWLVLHFRSSDNLAGAFGIAVSGTMVITTILAFFVMRERWHWNILTAVAVTVGFLIIDLAFFSSNLLKITDGGWFPLAIAVFIFTLMITWQQGRQLLIQRIHKETESFQDFLQRIVTDPPVRVSGTAVFLTIHQHDTPPALLYQLIHNKALHEQVVLVTVITEEVPRVPAAERLEVMELSSGFHRIIVHYGFMQSPNVPVALRACETLGLKIDLDTTTYYLSRASLIPTDERPGMALWRDRLFAFMSRNSAWPTAFYHLPPEHVIELGIQVEL